MTSLASRIAAPRGGRWLWLVLAVTALGLFALWALFLYAALNGVPLLAGDSVYFAPAIQQMRLTGHLVSPYVLHVQGTKFDWHSWLYPSLMALLPWTGDYFRIGASYLLLVLVAITGLGWQLVGRRLDLLAIALLPVAFAVVLFQMPRFELLSSVLLCASLPLLRRESGFGRREHALLILVIAGIGLIQPTLGVYCCLAAAAWLASRATSLRSLLVHGVIYAVSIFAIIALSTELHPELSFGEWVTALGVQAKFLSSRSDGSWLVYDVLDPQLFLKFVYFGMPALIGWRLWLRMGETPAYPGRKPVVAALLALFAFMALYTSVRLPGTAYNLIGLAIPMLFALHRLGSERWAGRGAAQVLIGIALLGSLGSLAYRTLAVAGSVSGGFGAEMFKKDMAALDREGLQIGVTAGLLPYADQLLDRTWVTPWPRDDLGQTHSFDPKIDLPPAVRILQQSDSGYVTPPPLPGYVLRIDRFQAPPRVPLMRTRKDFGYALYCRPAACAALPATLPEPRPESR